ncbi:MAG: arylesterase [Methylococcales bacterium]|nr:arylesterase [Methylococcales bacterium]
MKKILFCFLCFILPACDINTEKQLKPLSENAVILAFGDSLTYGVGTGKKTNYPAVLAKLSGHTVINKGVSGEKTKAGLKRLPKILDKYKPELMVLIHGGNDILKKMPSQNTIDNLTQMIKAAKQRNIQVVMLGVPSFKVLMLESAEFYKQIADSDKVPIDVDILPTIIGDAKLKSDTIHPNTKGYKMMAEAVYQLLQDQGALLNP